MKTVLITGASSGIGLELAKIFAREKHNLILVARRLEVLENLRDELELKEQIRVKVIQQDLAKVGAAEELHGKTKEMGLEIDALVNNAGFGDYGPFIESEFRKNSDMMQLNMVALSELSYLYSRDMVAKGAGKIMNVASTAAFQPGPLMAIYFATKAYVLSLSEALNNELEDKGVTVTALCPGATSSGFQAGANIEQANFIKNRKLPTSAEVAEFGYKAMMAGKPVAIHGFMSKLLVFMSRLLSRKTVVKFVRKSL